jgi:riboflavin kinase
MAAVIDIQSAIHLPDLNFVKYCETKYGLNRGVYNIVDSWFYQKGEIDIINRRRRIIHFLESIDYPLQDGRLKFGHGCLTPCLLNYLESNDLK